MEKRILIRRGIRNRVYLIDLNGDQLIEKQYYGESGISRAINENFALNLSRKHLGEIIPEVRNIDVKKNPAVVILENINGITLQESLSEGINDIFLEICREIFYYLKKIHNIGVWKSFRNFSSMKEFEFKEFVLYQLFQKIEDINLSYIKSYFSLTHEFKTIEKFFSAKNLQDPRNYKLIHGDLTSQHILIDNNHVCGILDWENSAILDPRMDYAYLFFGLLNKIYKDREESERLYRFFKKEVPAELQDQSFNYYLAGRAILVSSIYYVKYNPSKKNWAMKLAKTLLKKDIFFKDYETFEAIL